MFSSSFQPGACWMPPGNGQIRLHSRASKVAMLNRQALPCLQVRSKEKPSLQESTTTGTSRRDLMQIAVASVCLLSMLLPASAEAGARNATARLKIKEKLEEVRRKAGLPKPKHGSEEKKPQGKAEASNPKPKVDTKENNSKQNNGSKERDYEEKKPQDKAETTNPKLKAAAKENKPKLNNSGKEESLPTIPLPPNGEPSLPLPILPNILNGKTVQATISL